MTCLATPWAAMILFLRSAIVILEPNLIDLEVSAFFAICLLTKRSLLNNYSHKYFWQDLFQEYPWRIFYRDHLCNWKPCKEQVWRLHWRGRDQCPNLCIFSCEKWVFSFQFFHYLASVALYIPKNLLFWSTNLISLATLTSSLCLKYYGRLLGDWEGEGVRWCRQFWRDISILELEWDQWRNKNWEHKWRKAWRD